MAMLFVITESVYYNQKIILKLSQESIAYSG